MDKQGHQFFLKGEKKKTLFLIYKADSNLKQTLNKPKVCQGLSRFEKSIEKTHDLQSLQS